MKEKEEYILNFRQTNNQFNNTLSSIYRDEYCIYLRKSRADLEAEARGEGESLARHERILIELAKKYKLRIGAIRKEIVSVRPEKGK